MSKESDKRGRVKRYSYSIPSSKKSISIPEHIRITTRASFEGQTVYTFDNDYTSREARYFVTRDQSMDGYQAGEPIERIEIDGVTAKKFFAGLAKIRVGILPDFTGGLDGSTTTIKIENGASKVTFSWWAWPPCQWKNLDKIDGLFALAKRSQRKLEKLKE
jgi:hypothetical protein